MKKWIKIFTAMIALIAITAKIRASDPEARPDAASMKNWVVAEDSAHTFKMKVPPTWKIKQPQSPKSPLLLIPAAQEEGKFWGFVGVYFEKLQRAVDDKSSTDRLLAAAGGQFGLEDGLRSLFSDVQLLETESLRVGNKQVTNVRFTGKSKDTAVPQDAIGRVMSISNGQQLYQIMYIDNPAGYDAHAAEFVKVMESLVFND